MTDNCYIDGVSLRDAYGVVILKGGYNSLLAFPPMKEPPTESWPEDDGVDADLDSPALEPREVDITFLRHGRVGNVADLIEYLSAPGYRTLFIPSLGREWQLRMVSEPRLTNYRRAESFSLRFADDLPLRPVPVAFSPGSPIRHSVYELDGVPMSNYGIVVLSGRDSVLQSPAAKVNMSREVQTKDGRIYDAELLVFDSKDVKLKCLMKASTKESFWNCYDALFAALTAPGQRELYADYTSETYPCYYRSTSGWKLISLSPFMVEFTLTLSFMSFRVAGMEYILAAESGDWIITEQEDCAIDLRIEYYGNTED